MRLEIKEEIKRKSSNAENIVRIYFFYTSSKAYLLHHQFDELKELDKEVVINSIKNKWMLVVADLEKIPVNLK